ncbi:MAG: PcfJ domain-containing protein, partial [Atopobiaceae bacterium]|nr:PcfJ domain-containing protein [Atopobiaceae bacterium]
MSTQLTFDLGIDATIGVRDLIVRGDIERETLKVKREQPVPEWERVLMDGSDCAFRRRCGNRSQLLVLLVTQGQYYVTDERTGSRHALTTARLGTFCNGATGDALTPPWSARPLQDYDTKGRAAVVALLNSGDFREMCKRDMVRVEPWAASRMGSNARWNLSGTWEHVGLVWRLVEPVMGHSHCREALSAALRLSSFHGEGRDEACAECFRDRLYVSQFVESMGRDVTRDLLSGYLDRSAEHPRGGTADFLPRLACALRSFEWRGIAYEPRRACEYALSLLDMPAQRRRTRSYNIQLWADALDMQQRVRGSVEDRYPADPAALLVELEREREMRRPEANDAAIARRAADLDGKGFESDGYLIRPAATVREILDEANAQHTCVAG